MLSARAVNNLMRTESFTSPPEAIIKNHKIQIGQSDFSAKRFSNFRLSEKQNADVHQNFLYLLDKNE